VFRDGGRVGVGERLRQSEQCGAPACEGCPPKRFARRWASTNNFESCGWQAKSASAFGLAEHARFLHDVARVGCSDLIRAASVSALAVGSEAASMNSSTAGRIRLAWSPAQQPAPGG
jgi:hypothetical protein